MAQTPIDIATIPKDPGCYLYKNKSGKIIYIGKAKSLKRRVASYFSKTHKDEKTRLLVADIRAVEFFVTTTEVEALVLENNLIKKHKPTYNIDLKDSQRYAHILVTDEPYPRLLTARDKTKKGKYFGPFVSGEKRELILKLLRESFQIRTCNKLPKKACLRYHIDLCSAPCINEISKEDYNQNVTNAKQFLKGKTKSLIKKLHGKMRECAQKQQYEQAKLARDQIRALEFLNERQNVEKEKRYDEDVIHFIIDKETVYLIVFEVNRGVLATKREFTLPQTQDFLEEFLKRYYETYPVPKEIVLPKEIQDQAIQHYLQKLKKSQVRIKVPHHGPKKELLDLVKRNIEITFFTQNNMVNDLKEKLKLNETPRVIECFDISHMQGTNSVGSMVQFRDGAPDKSNYRKFKIKTVQGNDDFKSMEEVVKRRYSRLKNENKPLPDLIVIDGGRGQLTSALNSLQELELKVPIISLAKREEEIYVPGLRRPLTFKKSSPGLKLLMQIRDEAHRFAVTYHKLLRSKSMVGKNKWDK